jgi:hypothetical protein
VKLGPEPVPQAYGDGNLMISVPSCGEIREYTPAGVLVQTLRLPSGTTDGAAPAGSAFDAGGAFYVADLLLDAIFEFDANGAFVGTFGSGLTDAPESIVFDAAGDAYVGLSRNVNQVRKLAANGSPLDSFVVGLDSVSGPGWIDLASDQRTLLYTSDTFDVAAYDVVSDTQLPDPWFDDQGATAALRITPAGDILASNFDSVIRIDPSNGTITRTYLRATPESCGRSASTTTGRRSGSVRG